MSPFAESQQPSSPSVIRPPKPPQWASEQPLLEKSQLSPDPKHDLQAGSEMTVLLERSAPLHAHSSLASSLSATVSAAAAAAQKKAQAARASILKSAEACEIWCSETWGPIDQLEARSIRMLRQARVARMMALRARSAKK